MMRKKTTVDCWLVLNRGDPLSDLRRRRLLARDNRKLSTRNVEIRKPEMNR
jgi:hypothetical protein